MNNNEEKVHLLNCLINADWWLGDRLIWFNEEVGKWKYWDFVSQDAKEAECQETAINMHIWNKYLLNIY